MRRACALVLLVVACTDRPLPGETAGGTSTTTEGPDPTTGTPLPTTVTPTTGAPDPTTGDPGPATTSGPLPGTTSTTGVPADCGPPCPATWIFDGNLDLGTTPGDYTCLVEIKGDLRIAENASPADVATLANLTRVGKLTVANQPFTDLSTFACLERVGELILRDMPQLTDLSALASLHVNWNLTLENLGITALPAFAPDFDSPDEVRLVNNTALVDLGAIAGWSDPHNTDGVSVIGSPALTDVSPLAPFFDPEDIWDDVILQDLPALTSLAGLEGLREINLVVLQDLPAITDLAPLSGLKKAHRITLSGLPGVTDLSGLGALEHIGSELDLGVCDRDGLDGLTSLAGLDSLKTVGRLSIANCDNLTTLAGAPDLEHINVLDVSGNPQLSPTAVDKFVAGVPTVAGACFSAPASCDCF